MAQDAVTQVMSAEREAAGKISEARERAKQIIAEAEKAGRDMLVAVEDGAEKEVKNLLSKAKSDAESASKNILAEAVNEGEKLEALARGKMDRAAAVIVERVVKG